MDVRKAGMYRLGLLLAGLAPFHAFAVQPSEPGAVNVPGHYCGSGVDVFDGRGNLIGCASGIDFGSGGREPNIGGGGDPIVRNPGDHAAPQPDPNADVDCDKTTAGNPVVIATGNKIEPETDFIGSGDMPLSLSRTYNRHWIGIGLFGRNWISNFDYKLQLTTDDPSSPCYPRPGNGSACDATNKPIWAQRPDGRKIKFNYATSPAVGWYEDKPSPIAKIVRTGSGYTLYSEDHTVETYDASGFPLTIANEQAVGWTYRWNTSHYLLDVTHASGRKVSFGWTGNQLTTVTDPAGNIYRYTYTTVGATTLAAPTTSPSLLALPPPDPEEPPPPTTPSAPLLTSTVQPGVSSIANGGTPQITLAYHYEDTRFPTALTGKTINGSRYSWFSYDANGRAVETRHANNTERYTFLYTAGTGGSLTVAVTNPLGKVTTYRFDAKGRGLSVAGQPSAHCAYTYKATTYDSNGYRAAESDFRDAITAYTYNAKGQLLQRIEDSTGSAPRTTTYAWGTNDRLSRLTVSGYSQTDLNYTTNGRLASRTVTTLGGTGGSGRALTTTYAYTTGGNGLVTKRVVTGPASSDVVTYNYNATGDLVSVVNALGHTVSYGGYNALGLPGTMTDANGAVTTYVYDPRGRLASVSEVINGIVRTRKTAYNALGQVTDTWTPDSLHVANTYDAAYRLVESSMLESSTPNSEFPYLQDTSTLQTLYTYDANSNVTSVKRQRVRESWRSSSPGPCDGDLLQTVSVSGSVVPMAPPPCTPIRSTTTGVAWVRFVDYDELGRPIALRGNNGQNIRTSYDANGNVASLTDSANKVTSYAYDNFDRAIRVTDPAGGVTQMSYDLGDQLASVTDPRRLVTQYSRDAFGLLWRQDSPDTGTTLWSHDAYGRLASMTRSDGQLTSYGHDILGRLTTVSAGGKTQTLDYDTCSLGKGQLCSVTDTASAEQFTYNTQGQLLTQSLQTQGRNDTTRYGYDAYGRLASVTYPSGNVASYTYAAGQVSTVKLAVGTSTFDVVRSAGYDADGAVVGWIYGNNAWRSQSYDTDGRLKALSTGLGTTKQQDYTYSWDATDRLAGITSTVNPALSATYTYDVLGRLTRHAPTSGTATSLTYDANGNRTSLTRTGTESSTIAPTSNRLTQRGGAQYGYDANGNRSNWQQDGTTVSYGYDPFNRPASATRNLAWSDGVTSYPAGTTSYRINPLGQRVYKNGPTGEVWFTYNPSGQLMAEYQTGKGWTDYIYFDGQPVALVRNGARYFLYNDHLGRPEYAANSGGVVAWQANLGPFSRTVTMDGLGSMNLGFPGQYFDTETGHWYNHFRTYDSNEGRYLESDPIGLAGGFGTYSYAYGNPVMWTDPLGLKVLVCKQAAQVPGMGWVDHHWIKTDTLERGMGGTRGNVPGNQSGDMPGDPVEVTEHAGRSKEKNVRCESVENVNEKKVNDQLQLGTPLGRWGPTNQCQSFVRSVLDNARQPGATGSWSSGATGSW